MSALTSPIKVVDPTVTISIVVDDEDPNSVVRVVDPGIPIAVEVESSTPGPPGASAYLIAVANGFVGTVAEWLQSLKAAASGVVVTQPSPSASWVIPHGFGRPPNVQVYLPSGEMVLADVVSLPTVVSVSHAQPTTGFVVLT